MSLKLCATEPPKAFKELKAEGIVPESCELRQVKYLNNLVEQDHRAHQTVGETGAKCFHIELAESPLENIPVAWY